MNNNDDKSVTPETEGQNPLWPGDGPGHGPKTVDKSKRKGDDQGGTVSEETILPPVM